MLASPFSCSFPIGHLPFFLPPLPSSLLSPLYTLSPPTIVYADGSICLDILQQKWSPTYNVVGILTSIQSLLNDPNPNSPANAVAAKMFCENKREYERRVRECVEESWNDVSDDDEDDDEEEDDDDADEPEAEEGQLQPEAGSDVADQAGTAAASGSTSSQSADGRPDRAAAKRSALARADGASSDEPDLRSQLGGAAG